MAWYQEWFGEEYLRLYAHRNDDEAQAQTSFILQLLGNKKDLSVLDVACGTGRHLAGFAEAGMHSVGIDLSHTLIKIAHERLACHGEGTYVLRADMRTLPFPNSSFSLLTSMFTSFGYFETDQEHATLLQEWHRVLRSGGYLFLDYLNRAYTLRNLIPRSREKIHGRAVTQQRYISLDRQRVVKEITISSGHENEQLQFRESVRMFSKEELLSLLTNSGFNVLKVFGDFHGNPLSSSAPRLLVFAEARDETLSYAA